MSRGGERPSIHLITDTWYIVKYQKNVSENLKK